MHHLEAGRRVAQQPVRTRDVAGGQHKAVRAGGERFEQIAQHVPQPREAFERPQLEHLIEQEGARLAAGRAGGVEEDEQHVERLARRRGLTFGCMPRERRRGRHRLEKTFGCRGAALHRYILRRGAAKPFAQPLQQHRPPGAAAAKDDGDAGWSRFESAENPSIEPRMLTRHLRNSLCPP